MILSHRQRVASLILVDGRSRSIVHRLCVADAVRIKPRTGRDASLKLASIAETHLDGMVGNPRQDENRCFEGIVAACNRDQILVHNPQRVGGCRRYDGRIVPGQLGERVGEFLQPAVVGKTTIVHGHIPHEYDIPRCSIPA